MPPTVLRLIVLLAALAPSAWYAWEWRSMPHAAEYHDDGIYYVNAKSLAGTGKFSIESLPNGLAQTKYPPLWPAVLSIAWRIEPRYPQNLPWAMLLCWICLPASLFAFRNWLRQAGLSPNTVVFLCAAWALNPCVVLFSTTMLSEMLFTFLLLASIICFRAEGTRWAILAGVLSGLAFLTRTAGIALLPAAILFYLIRDRRKLAAVFSAAMLPAVIGWVAWSTANRAPEKDAATLFYTNYFGFYLATVEWKEFHVYLWKNLDGMLHGLGSQVLPNVTASLLDKILAQTFALAGIIGIVRVIRRDQRSVFLPYAVFAGVYGFILATWNFPPNERLMLPVTPLWLAGLYLEMKLLAGNIASVFRKPEASQKAAGAMITALLGFLLVFCVSRQWNLLTEGLPKFYTEHAHRLRDSEPAMEWIRTNLAPDARFLAQNDPLLYLRTGRHGIGLEVILNTIHWYREDHQARTADRAEAQAYAQKLHLEYFLLNNWDYGRDMPAEEHAKLIRTLRADPRLEPLFVSPATTVYRVR